MTSKPSVPLLAATPGMRFEIVTITPALATEWLAKNFERNRAVNKASVQRFAAEMKAGTWTLTHQGLAFDKEGRLIDGQHRLLAIKASGVSISMLVVYYESASPLLALDRGTTRDVGAVLEIDGAVGKGRGRSVAAICNSLHNLATGSRHGILTVDQIKRVYDAHRDGVGFAVGLSRSGRLSSPFAAAAAYTFPICPQRIEALFTQAINNDGPALHSGAWHLNNLLRQKVSNTHDQRLTNSQAAVKCVFLHMKDREVKLFKVAVEGMMDGMGWAQKERQKLGLCLGAWEVAS